jgi:Tol biopolymer transport system component
MEDNMHTQVKIVFRLLIVSAVLLGALGSVGAQDQPVTLLLIQDGTPPRLIIYEPVSRQEVVRELQLDALPRQLILWDDTTLVGLDTVADPEAPRPLTVIDVPTGRTRCTVGVTTPNFYLGQAYRRNLDFLRFESVVDGQAGVYDLNPANCELTLQMAAQESDDDLPEYATLSPDAVYAAYVVEERDEDKNVFLCAHLLNLATGEDLRLNEESFSSRVNFLWSPDSRYLIYGLSEGEHDVLYDTTAQTSLQLSSDEVWIFNIVDWSQDGRYMLYSNDVGDALLFDTQTAETQPLEADGTLLSFYPDDTLIVGALPCGSCSGPNLNRIWTFENGQLGDLIFQADGVVALWSRDHTRVVYYDGEAEMMGLFDLNTRENRFFDIGMDGFTYYRWSADDSRILFGGEWGLVLASPLVYYQLDTGEVYRLTDQGLPGQIWSPDGRYVLYEDTTNGFSATEMRLYDRQEDQTRTLYTYNFDTYEPEEAMRWSPDSRYALFVHDPDNGFECQHLMLDATTGETWSPVCDGTTVQFYWLP